MNPGYKMINSAERAAANPGSWEPTDAATLDTIGRDAYVKVGVMTDVYDTPGERFWMRVQSFDKESKSVTGIVEQSDMVFSNCHGINHGDVLTVSYDEVMDVFHPQAAGA